MNRRGFIGLFGLAPLLTESEVQELKVQSVKFKFKFGEVKIVTNFLISSRDEDGNIVYDVNRYNDYCKFIVECIAEHPLDIHKSLRLRFESKKIMAYKPLEDEKAVFLNKCIRNFDKFKLKPLTEVSEVILV